MNIIPIRRITSADVKQNIAGRFSIRGLATVLNGKDLVHDLHKHDFFFILAVQNGKGVHEIDFVSHLVQDFTIFLLRPGQVHRLELSAASNGFLMEFDPSFYHPKGPAGQRLKKAAVRNYCKIGMTKFAKIHSILENIHSEFIAKQEGYTEAIIAGLDLFFIEYIRQTTSPENPANAGNTYNQERFEQLIGLLEANIGTMKNVSQYAGLLNMSSYQLNAITKSSVGKNVSELINEQILLEAKRYLLATSNQVKEVADHLGYEDVSYFIRFFKKHTGHSPEAFRKNFK